MNSNCTMKIMNESVVDWEPPRSNRIGSHQEQCCALSPLDGLAKLSRKAVTLDHPPQVIPEKHLLKHRCRLSTLKGYISLELAEPKQIAVSSRLAPTVNLQLPPACLVAFRIVKHNLYCIYITRINFFLKK